MILLQCHVVVTISIQSTDSFLQLLEIFVLLGLNLFLFEPVTIGFSVAIQPIKHGFFIAPSSILRHVLFRWTPVPLLLGF